MSVRWIPLLVLAVLAIPTAAAFPVAPSAPFDIHADGGGVVLQAQGVEAHVSTSAPSAPADHPHDEEEAPHAEEADDEDAQPAEPEAEPETRATCAEAPLPMDPLGLHGPHGCLVDDATSLLAPLLPRDVLQVLPEAPALAPSPQDPAQETETAWISPTVSSPSARVAIDPLVGVVAIAAVSAAVPAAPPLLERLRHLALRTGAATALYTRLTKDRLLQHEARERILDALKTHPGSAIADLAHLTSIPRNTATHHLRMLEKQGFVSSLRQGRVRLFFVSGSGSERKRADALAALRHATTQELARIIGSQPGVDQAGLCERLAMAPSLAHWHVSRLVASNVVLQVRDGRRVRYYPGDAFHLVEPPTLGPGV